MPCFADVDIVTDVIYGPPVCPSVPAKDDGEERDSSHRHPTNRAKPGGGEVSAEGEPPPEDRNNTNASLQNTHHYAASMPLILSFEHLENKTGTAPVFFPL